MAPADCSLARTGVAGLQCRFFQSHPASTESGTLDQVAADLGFCSPVNTIYGDCTQYSEEHLYAIWDAAEAMGNDGRTAVENYCSANPLECATACYDLAHLDTIKTTYCTAHPTSNYCATN